MTQRINLPEIGLPRIVIIGAGFGGLRMAMKLKGKGYQIVLIDRNNYHQFQPLYYQVAMAGLEPSSICFPIRRIFQNRKDVFFRVCEVESIDSQNKKLNTNLGVVNFDYLVIATGAKNNYFGNANFEKYSLPLKSVSEALFLRNRILEDFEASLLEVEPKERQRFLDIVIVGGGPTGVEIAGALAELKKHVLPKDYPELNLNEMDIHLVQSRARILDAMSDKSSLTALDNLANMGVKVHLNSRVLDITDNEVTLSSGDKIFTKKVIWAAGIAAATMPGLTDESYHKNGRLIVDEFLRLKTSESIFAIGDVAFVEGINGHPQVAPVAMQQADYLANFFIKLLKKDTAHKKGFTYLDKGALATIGRNKAVAERGKLFLKGFAAWVMWLGVHIYFLIGVKNKIVVMFNWVWAYLFFDQGLRLLIKPKIKNN
ncbi:MAG: NAD(P)/FAD-dependent oxidoreductase [Saprospiraceae bacterium]